MNKKEIQFLSLCGALLFLGLTDASLLSTLMVKIAKNFGVSVAAMSGPVLWYIVGSCVLIPAVAWISKTCSKINVLLSAIVLFLLSSLICGLADNLPLFTFSRFIQGLTISVAHAVCFIMLMERAQRKNTVMIIGLVNLPAMAGMSAGPVIGALFAHYISWRYAFYFNIPICLALIVMCFFIKTEIPKIQSSEQERFDIYGFLTISVGLVMVSVGIEYFSEGDVKLFIYCTLTGILCLLLHAVLYNESKDNILKLSVFKDANFFMGTLVNITSRIGMTGTTFILSIYLQEYLHLEVLYVGIIVAIIFLFGAIAKIFSNTIIRMGLHNVLVLAISFTAIFLLMLTNINSSHLQWFHWMILSCFGFSMSVLYTAMNSVMLINIAPKDMSDACNIQAIIQKVFTGFGIIFSMILLFSMQHITFNLQLSFIYACVISSAIVASGLLILLSAKFKRHFYSGYSKSL